MKVEKIIITPKAMKILDAVERQNHDMGNNLEKAFQSIENDLPEGHKVKITPRHIFNFFFRSQSSIVINFIKGKKTLLSDRISFPKKFPEQHRFIRNVAINTDKYQELEDHTLKPIRSFAAWLNIKKNGNPIFRHLPSYPSVSE